jgi:hypothetical protein
MLIRVLENREEAWATLDFRRTVQVPVPINSSRVYDTTGGTLFLSKALDLEGSRVRAGYSYVTLPSLSDAQGENLEWKWCNLEAEIVDIGCAVHEHDLISCSDGVSISCSSCLYQV